MIHKNSELLRKLIHLSNLIIPFTYLFYFNTRIEALIVLAPITLFSLLIEYLRINSSIVKNIFDSYLFTMLRNHEISGKYTGATWVFIASTLSIAVFPKEIAVLSLVFMSIGDTTAGIIGRKFGRIKFYNKTFSVSKTTNRMLKKRILPNANSYSKSCNRVVRESVIGLQSQNCYLKTKTNICP